MKLQSDKELESEVLSAVELFRAGWEKMDLQKILASVSKTEDMLMYGTDLDERWIGHDALVEPTRAMTKAYSNAIYTWGENEPMVWVRGPVGWVCGNLSIDFDFEGQTIRAVMRSTFVVTQEDSGWKIAHAHFSIGQEDPVADYS